MSWQECVLGDVMTLQRGHDLPNDQREDGDVPVVSSSGITGRHSVAKAKAPGVVTGRYGTIGEVFYIEQDYWPLNTALYVTDFKGNDPRFVAYFLRSILRNYQSDKAAVPGVNRNVLHQIKVRRPDERIQTRIAALLSAYDDLIENNRRRIQLLEQSARLLYKEWFVYLRFPGHEHVKIKDGVPDGWARSTIREVCTAFEDGDWIESKDQGGEDFRLLQISNIGDNELVETGNFRWISSETFRNLRCNEVVPGDILIARMPKPIGRAWYVTRQLWRMVTAVDVTIARPNQEVVDPFYFLYHLNSPSHIASCESQATGATRPRISRSSLGALPIVVPPLSIQRQFGDVACSVNQQRALLVRETDVLSRARDLLLPRLMSGELAA